MAEVPIMTATGLDEFLESLGRNAKQRLMKLGFTEEHIRALAEVETPLNLAFNDDIPVPIHNGTGQDEKKKSTFWVHPQGEGYITAPDGGTWTIRAWCDNHSFMDKNGVTKGEHIPFSFKTGIKSTIKIEAIWSEKKDATLVLHLQGHT